MSEKKLFYTNDEASKMLDCEIQYNYEWQNGKFVRRGRGTAVVLIKFKDDKWIAVSQHISSVKVAGQLLQYIGKHSFTNPRCPFVNNLYK